MCKCHLIKRVGPRKTYLWFLTCIRISRITISVFPPSVQLLELIQFIKFVIALNNSTFGFHLCPWMSLCGYTVFFCHFTENIWAPIRKVQGSIQPQIVHSSVCVCSVGVALSSLTKTMWCTRSSTRYSYIWLAFITFPLTIHLDS